MQALPVAVYAAVADLCLRKKAQILQTWAMGVDLHVRDRLFEELPIRSRRFSCSFGQALLALQLEKWASPPVAEMQGASVSEAERGVSFRREKICLS